MKFNVTMKPCCSSEKYINSNRVVFHERDLRDDKIGIPDMAVYRTALIDALINQFNSYFPNCQLDSFSL